MAHLLQRADFRNAVFQRDNHTCINCGGLGQDAHHILERRLFEDGGYYLDNGATLCGPCHILAEQTVLGCDDIREKAGIERIVLPEHLYNDNTFTYDKWGNIILANGNRLVGELFFDESVQKILSAGGVLDLFTKYVKYPRTYHVPWSQPGRVDDKYLKDMHHFEGKEVVVTEKMDGENTTMYSDHIHARSIDSGSHPSRAWVKGLWSRIGYEIPDNWRVCGENLYAKHTVPYNDLESYFQVFSIWNERNECLDWDETREYAALLGLKTVPVLYEGIYDEGKIKSLVREDSGKEGWVIRTREAFDFKDFRKSVAKYVCDGFALPHGHWRRDKIILNGLNQ